MTRTPYTVDEAVDVLKRSRLPTVVTEGADDYFVFRRFEALFSDIGLDLMPVGGRETVLGIFERRHEITQIRMAFIVDLDIWVFSGIPEEYRANEVIFTDGYSIENDLYRDGEFENLLVGDEQNNFSRDCAELIRWYSYAVSEQLAGRAAMLGAHPDQVVDQNGSLKPDFLQNVGFTEHPEDLYFQITEDYKRLLRGKTLLSLLMRYLSYRRREVRHHHKQLMESASVRKGPYMTRIQTQLEGLLRPAA